MISIVYWIVKLSSEGTLRFLLLTFSLLLTGCQMVPCRLEPVITCSPPAEKICRLPSPFEPLCLDELNQDWGKELKMGEGFAREWDLYRAITCFKRALMLIPEDLIERKLQIEYDLLLAYYFGQKYQDVVNLFETSQLIYVNHLFPPFNNLLLLLYERGRITVSVLFGLPRSEPVFGEILRGSHGAMARRDLLRQTERNLYHRKRGSSAI